MRPLGDLKLNLVFTLRSLRRSPAFAAVAVVTLAIGIGASTAIFTVVDAALLQALPFIEPDRLACMHHHPSDEPDVPAGRDASVNPIETLRA